MKKIKTFFIALFVTLLLVGVATADMYKWVDENGVIHFSDHPPQNAESAREVKSISTYNYGSHSASDTDAAAQDLNDSLNSDAYGVKKPNQAKMPRVELYTTSWCRYCEKARDFFRSRGISFTEYDIEKDKSAARRKNRLDTRKGVPFAIVNGKRIHGFSEAAYARALGATP